MRCASIKSNQSNQFDRPHFSVKIAKTMGTPGLKKMIAGYTTQQAAEKSD
jgi:ribosomal protein S17E